MRVELTARHPDPQRADCLVRIAHHEAVRALHHGVAPVERRLRRQRSHPGSHVSQIRCGRFERRAGMAPAAVAQRRNIGRFAIKPDVHGVAHPRRQAGQQERLAVQPLVDALPGALAQVGHPGPLIGHIRNDAPRRVGRCGGSEVGHEIEQGRVGLVPDRAHHWGARRGHRPDERLVRERQQVLNTAPTAGNDDHVDGVVGDDIGEGSRVVLRARPDFYVERGTLSLRATDIRQVGLGELLARLEQLKRLLAAEGLFAPDRKRALPFLPRRIGLITGRASAAERDIVENARRRFAGVAFQVENVATQGPSAANEVVAALERLDADDAIDVIVIARGGGSI